MSPFGATSTAFGASKPSRPVPGAARLAQRHQDFAIRAELVNLIALAVFGGAVGDPNVAVLIHVKAVRLHEQTLAEVPQHAPVF